MLLVPTNRLIVVCLAVLVPVLTAAGHAGGGANAAMLALAVAAVPVALDALLGFGAARRMQVAVAADSRATQARAFGIEATVTGGGRVRLALDPPDGWDGAFDVLDAGSGPLARAVRWSVAPRDRGRFPLGAVFHESLSPLGLWAWRSRTAVAAEVRVFPDLREDRAALAPLFLRKAAMGLHRSRALGKGREFDQLREYLPGEGYEDIEWKATARRGKPVTKMHRIERSQDVYVVVDASRRSMRRLTGIETAGGHAPRQMDRFVRTALALNLAALQQGDRPGLAVFGASLRYFLRATGGRQQYNACRDHLFDLQAVPHPPDFADLFAELRNRIRQRSLLIFLTDLDDPVLAGQFTEEVSALARHHLVLVGQLRGEGSTPMFRREHEPADDEDVYARLAGHLLWDGQRQTTRRLRAGGVHCVTATSARFVPDLISAYLDLKRRQLL